MVIGSLFDPIDNGVPPFPVFQSYFETAPNSFLDSQGVDVILKVAPWAYRIFPHDSLKLQVKSSWSKSQEFIYKHGSAPSKCHPGYNCLYDDAMLLLNGQVPPDEIRKDCLYQLCWLAGRYSETGSETGITTFIRQISSLHPRNLGSVLNPESHHPVIGNIYSYTPRR